MKHLRLRIGLPWLNRKLAEEQGSVLIISLLILVVLTMLGAVASNMSITELQSAGNEKRYNDLFYKADSGWQVAPQILNDAGGDAPTVGADNVVTTGTANETTYTITEVADPRFIVREGLPMDGSYTVYQYEVEATAEGRQTIRVILNKPYQTN